MGACCGGLGAPNLFGGGGWGHGCLLWRPWCPQPRGQAEPARSVCDRRRSLGMVAARPFGGGVIGNTAGSGPVVGGSSPPPRAAAARRPRLSWASVPAAINVPRHEVRSEEHTSELHPLMRTSYAAFCLKK